MADHTMGDWGPTRWSLILRAKTDGPEGRRALGELVGRYDRTIAATLRRYRCPPDRTYDDLKAEFLASFVEGGAIDRLDPSLGRFRGWLGTALRRHVAHAWRSWRTKKKGNDLPHDAEALEAFQLLCRTEGIIPALEPSHAIAAVARIAPTMPKDSIIIVNMCGRGDKDIFSVAEHLGVELLSATKGRGTGRVIEDTGAADFGSMRDG